jgi:hypothetical protein
MIGNVQSSIIIIIVVLAGIAVLQFQKGRKINVALMKTFIRGFEEKLKLSDKTYVYLGGYLGFKAEYDLENKLSKRIEITLTLIPRQSVFYLPITFLTKKTDRLYVVIRPNFKIHTDAHIVKKHFYWLGLDIDEEAELEKKDLTLKGKEFLTLYRRKSDVDKLKELVNKCIPSERLFHIALVNKTNVFYCLMRPDPLKTPEEIRKLVEYLPRVIYEKEKLRDFQ